MREVARLFSFKYMCIKQAFLATWQVSPLWEKQTDPESWSIAMKCAFVLWAVGDNWAAVTHHKNPGCSAAPAREAGKDDEVWMLSEWAEQLRPGLPLLCSSEPAVKCEEHRSGQAANGQHLLFELPGKGSRLDMVQAGFV